MTTKFVQRGDVLNWTNGGSAKAAGAVIALQHMIGVALTDIASGAVGAVAVEGVYELPKVSGAVFLVGEKLVWDDSAGAFDDAAAVPAANDLTGAVIAMRAGANGETTCLVKLTPGNVLRS